MSGWVQIRSWHIWSGITARGGRLITLCGKQADGPTTGTFPFAEKTCESCARLQLKKESET